MPVNWSLRWLAWASAVVVACGEPQAQPADTAVAPVADSAQPGVDAATDTLRTLPDNAVTAADGVGSNCPGGPGCACAQNGDCDNALCIDTPAGRRCAVNCTTSCPDAFKCAQVSSATGDIANVCVPTWGRLCDPCQVSKSCVALGQPGGQCVAHGAAGAYCGAACAQDTDCPPTFTCRALPTVEGAAAKQCVPKGTTADDIGACTCSPAASAAGLSTTCLAKPTGGGTGACPGTRSCGTDGLTVCLGAAATAEVCDSIDNDCDAQTDEGACDDGASCTADYCDKNATGGCAHDPQPGLGCNADDSVCTENDTCDGAVCKPGKPKDCTDDNACTLDSCVPKSGCAHAPDDGAKCNDDNPCTIGDLCAKAICVPGAPKPCSAGAACQVAQCEVATGKCGFGNASDGLGCDDVNLCTTKDACASGLCQGKVTDCDDANPCTNDGCAAQTGCTHTPAGAPCNDGNACTAADTCKDAVCVGIAKPATACDDQNGCTKDTCEPVQGCAHATVTDGSGCDDGDKCTPGDKCQSGACTAGANICPCKVDADCASADDGNLCNGTMACVWGPYATQCVLKAGSIVVCDTAKDTTCTVATCAPKTGQCAPQALADGTACDADGSVCTQNDACKAGACSAGAKTVCDDKNPCTDDACDKVKGCGYVANLSPCDADGSDCTIGDTCAAKVCLPGAVKSCNDSNPCTVDQCDPKSGGCNFKTLPKDASPCDADGSACTDNDACSNGSCIAGKVLNCDDANVCTSEFCDPKIGCTATQLSVACDADGSLCTAGDKCTGGKCVVGPLTTCNDNQLCTKDSCNPKSGQCAYDVIAGNGTPCDSDGSVCTENDACAGGKCVIGKAIDCNDQNPCTTDDCAVKTGCTHVKLADGLSCGTGKVCKAGQCKAASPCNAGLDVNFGGPQQDEGYRVVAYAGGFVIAGMTQVSASAKQGWLVLVNSAGKIGWSTTVGPGDGQSRLTDVATAPGGFVASGFTTGKSAGGKDAWVVRFDAKGAQLSETTFGGAGDDEALAVQPVPDGTVIVGNIGQPQKVGLVAKIDGVGAKLWSISYGPMIFTAVALATGGVVAGGHAGSGSSGNGATLVKLDGLGSVLWTKTMPNTKNYLDALVAHTDGYSVFGSGLPARLWRTDVNGNVLWHRDLDGVISVSDAIATPTGYATIGTAYVIALGGSFAEFTALNADGAVVHNSVLTAKPSTYGAGLVALADGYAITGQSDYNLWVLRTDPWFASDCPTSGACADLLPADCADADPCTLDWCSATGGCTHKKPACTWNPACAAVPKCP